MCSTFRASKNQLKYIAHYQSQLIYILEVRT